MPQLTFVPLLDISGSVPAEHVHGAVCGWLDREAVGWAHDDNDKPYSITPVTVHRGEFGVQVATLTEEATAALGRAASQNRSLRLGSLTTRVGPLRPVLEVSWQGLADARASHWLMEFQSPTVFRSGQRTSPLPTPSTVLRAPRQAWDAFSPVELKPVEASRMNAVWVSDLDLETVPVDLLLGRRQRSGRRAPVNFRGVVGTVSLRADDADTAALVAPLFALAPFSGIGSFRGKGMGAVEVRAR